MRKMLKKQVTHTKAGHNILSLNNLLSMSNVKGTVRGIGETAVNNIKSLLS